MKALRGRTMVDTRGVGAMGFLYQQSTFFSFPKPNKNLPLVGIFLHARMCGENKLFFCRTKMLNKPMMLLGVYL